MAPLRNPRHEHFCQLAAAGHSPAQAYVAAGYSERTAYTSGPRLLKTPGVRARVAELQQTVAQAAVNRAVIDRGWVLASLRNIVENGASESAKVRALELCGKELGMFANHSSRLEDMNPDDWTEAQLEAVANYYLKQAVGPDPQVIAEARKQLEAGTSPLDLEALLASRTQA